MTIGTCEWGCGGFQSLKGIWVNFDRSRLERMIYLVFKVRLREVVLTIASWATGCQEGIFIFGLKSNNSMGLVDCASLFFGEGGSNPYTITDLAII